jgi:hypothetical protein
MPTTPPGGPTPPNSGNPGNPGNPYNPNALAQGLFDLIRQNEEARKLKDTIEAQTSYLNTQKTLRSEILSLSKKLYEVSRDIEYLEDKELGTRETVLSIDKEINKALKAGKQLETDIASIKKDQSREAQNLKASLDLVIAKNEENVKLLNEQKKLSEQIRNNFGVKPYSLLAEIFEKIGGKASLISAPFEKGAKFARESAKESFLNNKKIEEQINLETRLADVIAKQGVGISKKDKQELGLLGPRGGVLRNPAAVLQAAMNKKTALPDLGNQMGKLEISMRAFTSGLKGLIGGLTDLLKGSWIGILVSIGKFFIDAMFAADKQVTDIAKNFNISKDAARKTRDSFFQITDRAPALTKIQEGNLLLQKDIVETNIEFNSLLGTSVNLAADLGVKGEQYAVQLANATKFLGLAKEEQKGLIQSTAITGKTIDQTKNSIVGITRLRKLETGLLVNERKILTDVLTASNSIKLSIKGGEEGLTRAAIKAQELGLSLSKVDKIADSLLNFESSITAELEAELLTGKELNLEQARYYALTNDIEGLTAEIANNQELLDTFAESNRLTQAKIAQSLGMSREEMADMVTEQATLNKFKSKASSLDADTLEQLKKNGSISEQQYNDLKAGKGAASDYYRALKESGNLTKDIIEQLGETAIKSLEAQDAQSKFNDVLEKAKETFSRFVDGGSLDKFADFLTKFVSSVGIKGLFRTIFGGLADDEEIKQFGIEETEKKLAQTSNPEERKQIEEELQKMRGEFKQMTDASNQAYMNSLSNYERNKIENAKLLGYMPADGPKLAVGGYVKKGGSAIVDTGEVYLGTNSLQIIKEMKDALVAQNVYLAAIATKDPNFYLDSTKLTDALGVAILS